VGLTEDLLPVTGGSFSSFSNYSLS